MKIYSVIAGTGKCIPSKTVRNVDFMEHEFLDRSGNTFSKSNEEIIQKFQEITTINKRQYAEDEQVTSDLAYDAALKAVEDSGVDPEDLDHIIVSHNFGDVQKGSNRSDFCPTLAARVKQRLGIRKSSCVAYDMAFGCPGWLQAVIQADYYIKSGDAQHVLVIGAETLSRVIDKHDRDSMLYSDGAGAVVLSGKKSEVPIGILGHGTRSDALDYAHLLVMDEGYSKKESPNKFLKMQGRKLYEYALKTVPQAIKNCLDKCNVHLNAVNKVLIHQANGKMDHAIMKRLYKLYDGVDQPADIMPMTVDFLGNSSVATLPTLLDLIRRSELEDHQIEAGDVLLFASVGAGMNVNALVYQVEA